MVAKELKINNLLLISDNTTYFAKFILVRTIESPDRQTYMLHQNKESLIARKWKHATVGELQAHDPEILHELFKLIYNEKLMQVATTIIKP